MTTLSTEPEVAPPAFNEKVATEVEALVLRRIERDTVSLPALPAVAQRCMEALKQPEFSFRDVAVVVEHDPILTARFLRLIHSVAVGGSKNGTLAEGLARLGTRQVKSLLLEVSAQTLFQSRDVEIGAAAKVMWEHSLAVAVLCRDLRAIGGGTDSELAYLAGLLHDVGKPLVASFLLEAERQIGELRNKPFLNSAEWSEVIRRTHRKVGVALAQKWALEPEVSATIRDCSDYDASNRTSVSNVVCFANAVAKEAGLAPRGASVEEAKVLVMIGRSMLGVDDAILGPLVASLKKRVSEYYAV